MLSFFQKNKKDILYFIIVVVISLIFICLFFNSRHFFNDDPILHSDHAGHFAYTLIYSELIFQYFQSSYGYFYLLYNGMPFIHLFPPGYFIIIYILHFFGISYTIGYKIVLFGLMLLYGVVPYFLLRKIKMHPIAAIMGSLWAWIGGSFLTLERFNNGGTQHVMGCILGLVFLICTIEYENENGTEKWSYLSNNDIKMIFLLFSIAIINFTSILILAVVIIEKIILQIKNIKIVKQFILHYFKIAIGALILYSFYLLPTLLIQWPYITINYDFYLFTFDYSLWWNSFYIERLWFPTLITILLLFVNFKFHNSSKIIQTIRLIAFTSLFWVFVLPFFKIPFLLGINSYRQIIYFELISPLIYGIAIGYLIQEIKNKTLFVKDLKNITSRQYFIHLLKGLVIFIIFMFSFFTLIPSHPLNFSYTKTIEDSYYGDWYPEDRELIEWIKENTTNNGRILLQNSGYSSGYLLSGGHTSYYLALITNRTFATGYTSEWHYIYSEKSNFLEDSLYGTDISNITESELESYLITYNIEYIIVWSTKAKDKLNEFSISSSIVEHITQLSKYEIYRYKNAMLSYVILSNGGSVSNYQQTETKIQFNLNNCPVNSNIIISWHNYPNWKLYIDGEKVEKFDTNLGLIEFTLSRNDNNISNNMIELVWEKSIIETSSQIISISVAIILICLPIIRYFKKNGQKKNSP